jgi:hypothetical protein
VRPKLAREKSELAKQSEVQAGCVCALSIHHDSTFALFSLSLSLSLSFSTQQLVFFFSPAHNLLRTPLWPPVTRSVQAASFSPPLLSLFRRPLVVNTVVDGTLNRTLLHSRSLETTGSSVGLAFSRSD